MPRPVRQPHSPDNVFSEFVQNGIQFSTESALSTMIAITATLVCIALPPPYFAFESAAAVCGSNRSEKRLCKQKTPYPQEMGTAENARHTHPL